MAHRLAFEEDHADRGDTTPFVGKGGNLTLGSAVHKLVRDLPLPGGLVPKVAKRIGRVFPYRKENRELRDNRFEADAAGTTQHTPQPNKKELNRWPFSKFKNVGKRFGGFASAEQREPQAFCGKIGFRARHGQLIGPNGAGKSQRC